MRPLLTTDPEAIGPYRLLARIGTGGMGVVYLARSEGGTLAAVKVIRAEHAADPSFRARFRREARAAARVDARWTTPVLAADPEAPEPWLATAFVPGPSLAEIIAGHGPLPPGTVRALGARLVEALTAVHAAGLVHRDIKPGNVLLALDGPRLIDFGIARTGGATALTATDVVIGTPGYLSPEQARARGGEPGPPSDVFSLGCLLAYAAAGRPPYGTGMAASVIFRTIHEAPDLTGVPDDPLRTLIARCLAKSPAARPTLPELRVALGHFGTDDWLPPGLPALIAERSAQVLDLPEPQRTEPPTLVDAPPTPTRRRFLLLGTSAGAALAAGGATAAWYATTRSTPHAPAVPTRAIAVHADLTGPGKALGTAIEQAVRLAVSDHNAHEDRGFDLALQVHDDHGEAARSQAVARQLTADGRVCAVIGPSSDTTALATRDIYTKASLPMVTAWAGSDDLYATVSSTHPAVFQLRPADYAMPTPLFRYLTGIRPVSRWALIQDDAARDFSWLIAKPLTENAPAHGTVTTHTVPADSDDFAPAAAAAIAARAQAVVYCGNSPQRAAAFARALRTAGFTGTAAAAQPVLDPSFLAAAGAAAEGWVFSSTWVDPARLAPAATFVRDFTQRYGVRSIPPGAAEAYDALGMVAHILTQSGTGPVDPGSLIHPLRSLSYRGITRTFAFDASTGAVQLNPGLFLWQVRQGRPDFLGQYQQVKAA
ncbi:bifunctional serine/threonine-protein kinase/ABC transporter substrate-binding protein [Streptomyces sp. CoH27]|uniref:bifunctional serine/threonine-protein kinase/ABC transporter substrate-binding protein n=1 Tax=Streptomyces sp. CoH27 TaxID=2875763 RepID=UPI001CD70105|nr:bifunctional serine/threonine-protein kinase/ABC transporter substrate-binding protein [Streptomyces sp. CoH27]